MLSEILPQDLCVRYGLDSARIGDRPFVQRRLSDVKDCFADSAAVEAALAEGNPVLYEVTAIEAASGEGQLHYGLGILYPGKIGDEYWLTKGHLHSHRPAAEVYVGLKGEGVMLLEDEHSGESRSSPLCENTVVYVPGHTAHRTINTGTQPLVYLGIYPANAGHDYSRIAEKNFRMQVVEENGKPVMKERKCGVTSDE